MTSRVGSVCACDIERRHTGNMAYKGAAMRPSYSAQSVRSGRRSADRAHNVFVQAGKNRFSMEDVCPCCNPGYDGACAAARARAHVVALCYRLYHAPPPPTPPAESGHTRGGA